MLGARAEEQLGVFSSLSAAEQSELLGQTLDYLEALDEIGGETSALRADLSGALNATSSDLEIQLIVYFCLSEKFKQYGATLPGGGGP